MFIKGDSTLGSNLLEGVAIDRFNKLSQEEKDLEIMLVDEFKRDYRNSWLLQILCSYRKSYYGFRDLLWYRDIKNLILEGNLYMALFELDNWAFSDAMIEENINNIKPMGVEVDLKNKRNSDGLFTIDGDLILYKVYPTDEQTPSKIDDTIIITNPVGTIEFGDQMICKTAASLLSNKVLLRVPYPIRMLDHPMGAILFNPKEI